MRTRAIPGPRGPFLIPAEPEATSMHAEQCCLGVFDGEYSYPREAPEDVRTVLDIGANCGAFSVWAPTWWPTIERIHAYEPNADAVDVAQKNGVIAWCVAVTSRAFPQALTPDENWGARRIVAASPKYETGLLVGTIHPGELGPADAIKCDVEGSGAEVFAFYRHWDGIKVAMYESHNAEERDLMANVCVNAGLRMVRGNRKEPECDVRVWVR